jgi:hypothetical protein
MGGPRRVANNQKQHSTIQESHGHGKSRHCPMAVGIFLLVVPDGDYILHNQVLLDRLERPP